MHMGKYENVEYSSDVLRCLLEYSTEAFFSVDTQWRILALNRQAEIFCQKPQIQLLGRTLWNAFPAIATPVFSLKAHEALQQHKSLEDTVFASALNAWFTIRLYPSGTGLALFIQEITGWKQAEEEKQTSGSLAQAILDSIDVRMALLDTNGTICAINEAWKRQAQEACTTADQLERTGIGINYLEVCEQAQGACVEGASETLEGIKAVLQGTQPSFTLEYPCFSATQQYWYMLRVTPLAQNKGVAIAHIDITERKLFDQQKDTFISMAAHELRTPLTALKALVQLEKRKGEKQGIEDQKHTLTKIETLIDRFTQLVTELLDVSKIQAGTLDYAEERINLDEVIEEVVEMARQANPGHTLNIHGIPTHAMVAGDYDKLSQVFTNLLSNAIKYSPQANTVDISMERLPDSALVRIQDYGIGIPDQHLNHIFERFYRINTSKRNRTPGLGMGLYIAHEIVKYHRGTITVTSEEDKGSTFSVQLPLCETQGNDKI